MPTTVVKRSEFDRIRSALFHAGELIALEALITSPAFPLHILQILQRLPVLVTRIRDLLVSVEAAAVGFFEAEQKVIAHVTDSRVGVMEVAALALAPIARVALGAGVAWVKFDRAMPGQLAPVSTTDLVARLAEVGAMKKPTMRIDTYEVNVQSINPSRRFVVYVPGTKAFLGGPLDMRTNVLELAGVRSPVEAAVELALEKVGAASGDRVTVVGHSLGGMVAVSLAERSKTGQVPYSVDKVLEIGAPVGRHYPISGLKLLSVDGKGDLIPLLDGFGVPQWAGSSQLRLDQGINPVKNHEIEGYLSQLEAMPEEAGWQAFGAIDSRAGLARYFEFGVTGVPW
ncbi:MAG: hypothetical protein ACKOWJ_00740 [Micrococcales bacterium]